MKTMLSNGVTYEELCNKHKFSKIKIYEKECGHLHQCHILVHTKHLFSEKCRNLQKEDEVNDNYNVQMTFR